MIAADEVADLSLTVRDELRSPVAANIMEGPDSTIIVPQDQHRGVSELKRHDVAGLGHIRLLPDEDPMAAKDQVEVGAVECLVHVEGRLQAVPGNTPQEEVR